MTTRRRTPARARRRRPVRANPAGLRKTVLSVSGDEYNGDALWRTAQYGVAGEHWEADDDSDERPTIRVWRYSLPDDVFAEHDWAVKDIKSIASTMGTSAAALRAAGTSKNPQDREWALSAIGGHHGWDNIDGYPLEMRPSEMRKRWRGRL